MAKLTGPLFSLRARASIGKTLTYSSWRGIQYVRTDVIPANPRTSDQRDRRAVFSFMNGAWLRATSNIRNPWHAQALGQPYTDRNHFVGINARAEFLAGDLSTIVFSPGNGAPPPVSVTPADAGTSISLTVVPSDAPVGWTLVNVFGAALLDVDPTAIQPTTILSGSDADEPYVILIPAANGTYQVAGWAQYADPSGVTRYSISSPAQSLVMA